MDLLTSRMKFELVSFSLSQSFEDVFCVQILSLRSSLQPHQFNPPARPQSRVLTSQPRLQRLSANQLLRLVNVGGINIYLHL